LPWLDSQALFVDCSLSVHGVEWVVAMTRRPPSSSSPDGILPEWVPGDAHDDPHFASRVMTGVKGDMRHGGRPVSRKRLSLDDYAAGVLAGDITVLSRAITLVESHRPDHEALAQQLLTRVLPFAGNSVRVGISGVPGAGKSTLIEALGCLLADRGHKVAVIAVDPSSSVSGGSILGDKTRMMRLAGHPRAFIRPSPSAGSLGGVARKSRETILLCEAAGFDVILVETVGTGQNEITVRSMVDCFLLLLLAGAGDDLQGMKKGIMEIADILAVNKADGENIRRAQLACAETNRSLHLLQPSTPGWTSKCVTCSALAPDTLAALWDQVDEFAKEARSSGVWENRRKCQSVAWMRTLIAEDLEQRFARHPLVRDMLPALEVEVADQSLPAAAAARQVLNVFFGSDSK
jgi:LAO/AO transport system kinase